MSTTIVPLRIPCLAGLCCGSQTSQLGGTFDCLFPLANYIESSRKLILREEAVSNQFLKDPVSKVQEVLSNGVLPSKSVTKSKSNRLYFLEKCLNSPEKQSERRILTPGTRVFIT